MVDETDNQGIDCFLDAKAYVCPMPLLKLKQQLNRMVAGQRISVETTDAGSVIDFAAFCKQAGHLLLEQSCSDMEPAAALETVQEPLSGDVRPEASSGCVYRFLIQKRPDVNSQG